MQFDINCPQTSNNPDGNPQKALGKDAKQAAKQPAWCQEIKISSRARPFGITAAFPHLCRGSPKCPIYIRILM